MIKEETLKYTNPVQNNIVSNISSNSDFQKLILPINLPDKIEKIDHTNLNIENFNKSCENFLKFSPVFLSLSEGTELSSPLQFDLQPLIHLNISDFLTSFTKNTSSPTSSTSTKGLFFFVIVKYLTQLSDVLNGAVQINFSINNQSLNMNEETLMKKLNEMYLSFTESEVLWSYRHKLLNSNLNLRFENIIKDKEMFMKIFTYERTIEMIKQKLIKVLCPIKEYNSTNTHLLELGNFFEAYFINSLSFIHFNEYLVLLEKGCVDYKQRIEISLLQLILLSSYFIWRNSIKNKIKADFKFDEIINHFFKYSIINTLELVINAGKIENFEIEKVVLEGGCENEDIKSVNINLITCLFRNLLKIIFEIEINSKEVYIFSILSTLILYMRYLQPNNLNNNLRNLINPSHTLIEYVNSTKLNTTNIIFIRKILNSTNKKITETCPLENELILLIKLVELYFLQKYNKDLLTISSTIKKINIGDFLVGNLFLYENVYDDVKSTYSKFKDKVYWNFGEIISSVFTPLFPKMLKKTLLRHVQYRPHDDCLTYHLIQYYYTNKDFRKSKILISKILAKDDSKSEIIFDIHSISLMMLVNILISEEKYGEALDYAIFNLERLKDGIRKKSNESNGKILINQDKQNEQKNPENSQIITRSYFILGFCYSKLGDNATNFEEKLKYSQLALSSFKSAIEDTKEGSNPNFGYFFARQYYDLKLYTLAEETLQQIIDNSSASNVNFSNNHHFQSLKILIYIAKHQYDSALRLCDTLIRNNQCNIVKFSTILVLKFYLLIQKLFNNNGDIQKDEEVLIHKMSEYIKIVFDAIEEETKSLDILISGTSGYKNVRKSLSDRSDGFMSQFGANNFQFNPNGTGSVVSQETSFKIQLDPKQVEVKELIKFSEFEPFLKENITDEDLKSSVKVFLNERKNLENIRLEVLKNFYLLADMLMENNFDKEGKIDCKLAQLLSKTFIANPNEDINILLIKAIQHSIDKKDSEAENLYRKILENHPVNLIALKRLSKILLNKNDYANAYIFINKAIKLDEEESELWSMLSIYYIKNGDNAKYYECVLKELEIAKFHSNAFLNALVPKNMI